MQIASGSDTGNGTSQNITTPGWAADVVLVKGGSSVMQLWTSAMGATSCKPLTGSTALDATTGVSQHASGFTVAGNAAINTNATTYYWLAIRDDGTADFQVGSYTGNGGDSRNLTPLDFDPNLVIIASATTNAMVFRTSTMSGDASTTFNGTPGINVIQSFITNGWQVGTDASVNTNAVTYYYAAFKNSDLFKVLDDGSNRAYQGNATDNRTITGAGFQPDAFALTKAVSSLVATTRFKAHTGDQSADVDAASSTATDRIQAFAADGFQVGAATRVNSNGVDYHAFVFKEGTSTGGGGGGAGHGQLLAGYRNRLVVV
jgi:hypothetical protein